MPGSRPSSSTSTARDDAAILAGQSRRGPSGTARPWSATGELADPGRSQAASNAYRPALISLIWAPRRSRPCPRRSARPPRPRCARPGRARSDRCVDGDERDRRVVQARAARAARGAAPPGRAARRRTGRGSPRCPSGIAAGRPAARRPCRVARPGARSRRCRDGIPDGLVAGSRTTTGRVRSPRRREHRPRTRSSAARTTGEGPWACRLHARAEAGREDDRDRPALGRAGT